MVRGENRRGKLISRSQVRILTGSQIIFKVLDCHENTVKDFLFLAISPQFYSPSSKVFTQQFFDSYILFDIFVQKNFNTVTSEDRIILDYMAILNHLSPDLKLCLIIQMTNSLRKEYVESIPEKDESWKGLFGAWRDTDESLVEFVREGRLPDREVSSFE